MLRTIKKYKYFQLVIVVDRIAIMGGALKSVLAYYKHKNAEREHVLLLNRGVKNRLLKLVFVALLSPRILVNSLSSFHSWSIISLLLFRRDAIVYFHESETAIEDFRRKNKLKYYFLKKVLNRNKVACIAKLQQRYLTQEFGSKTILLYNYIPVPINLERKPNEKVILMAGYLTERKGVTFFSNLADLAINEMKLPWTFLWAGSRATKENVYLSKNVLWLGDVEDMDHLYSQVDALFLSSIDEPFGLVCIEALKHYKHVITYKNSGAAEILSAISGCAIFHEYNISAGLAAINEAFSKSVDRSVVDATIKEQMSLETFVQSLDGIFKLENNG